MADLTSAGMWTTAGLIGASMYLLPGSPHEHLGYGLLIAGTAILWGAVSLLLWHKRWTMSLATRAVATTGTAPLVATAIWASGGASSFIQPLLLFTALFISYFFPPRLAWPLMVFDFDGFKSVNDLHGHPVGDAVLVGVANACDAVIREGDTLARLGGDEFAVIAPSAGVSGRRAHRRLARGGDLRRRPAAAGSRRRRQLRPGDRAPRRRHRAGAARLRRPAPALPQAA
ncbi:MAG TPA: GGDEF domain-containing protein [Solirubrobacteraceae bacterium]|nr:GGDEF domain-containing protein [Solirubrobacteraceae bacterium]